MISMKKYWPQCITGFFLIMLLVALFWIFKTENQTQQKQAFHQTTTVLSFVSKQLEAYLHDTALDTDAVMQKIMSQETLKDYWVSFKDNQNHFYQNVPFISEAYNAAAIQNQVAVGSRRWTISLTPLSTGIPRAFSPVDALYPLMVGFALWATYLFRSKKTLQTRNGVLKQRLFGTTALLPELFCELDAKFKIRFANPLFLKTFGLTENNLWSGYDVSLLFTAEERFTIRKLLAQLTHSHETHRGVFEMQKDGMTVFPSEAVFAPFKNEKGEFLGIHCLLSDISEKQNMEQRIKQLTYYDELTGLPNRVLFKNLVEQEIARHTRFQQPTALLLISVDPFKLTHGAIGFMGADALLKHIAERLTDLLRQGDTLARVSSEEFAIILSHTTFQETEKIDAAHSAQVVARKILTNLTKPFFFDGREIFMSANIGIALYPQDASDVDSFIQAGDAALAYSRTKGKNNYQFYFQDYNVFANERLDAEKRLRYALKKQEFDLRYLPKYHLTTGKLQGIEALLSWQSPERGTLLPEKFLSFAEENGLIVPIGKWVLKAVCAQLQEWKKTGFSPLRMAVNFSIRQIQEENFLNDIQEILQEYAIMPDTLEFEIEEKVLLSKKVEAKKILQAIKDLGIHLVLDDFGKGYSSLSYLRHAPVSQIKIDALFMRQVPQNMQNRALVEGLITFAHRLGLSVTAEGVETKEQYEFLKETGCDAAQGFYFSKPLKLSETEALLKIQLRD